jgi:hypothetical protein
MQLKTLADEATPTPRQALAQFGATSPYRPFSGSHITGNPYRRPLDAARLAGIDWSRPLTEQRFTSDESLIVNRFLMNVYESDALFLPAAGLDGGTRKDFEEFYSTQNRLWGEISRPHAERYALGFLDDSIRTAGSWDAASLVAHLETAIGEATRTKSPVLEFIDQLEEEESATAAEMLIAQMALDGLTEATAMSQNLGGAFGAEQSELFKIFIDEFGYGVFDAKHSTLFTALCGSVGMSPEAHHYWFFYLPSSIAINNYFYVATRNRSGFFRYIGAMAYLEATFAGWFAALTTTLRQIYGDTVDTRYCDEHAHIDQHHGRMAVHDLVLPLAEKHGPSAARDMIQGIEEIRLLGGLADADLIAQLRWQPVVGVADEPEGAVLELGPDTPFETQIADADRLICVLRGHADLHKMATGEPVRIEVGQCVRVPSGRLYGLRSDVSAAVVLGPTR